MSLFGNLGRFTSAVSLGVVAAGLAVTPAAASAHPATGGAGVISLVAGNGRHGYAGDGGPAKTAELGNAYGVATDAHGNLLIADGGNNRVRVVAAASGTFYGQSMTTADIYTVAGNGTLGSSGNGGPATAAELNDPHDVAVDGHGNLIIADSTNNRVRVVAAATGTFYGRAMKAGDIYELAGNGKQISSGDGGPAAKAGIGLPSGVTVDRNGNVLITDYLGNEVRAMAASSGTFYGQAMTAGDIYTIAGGGGQGEGGDGGPATAAKMYWPLGVTTDSHGNVLIVDSWNLRVRVVAVTSGTFYGKAMTAGDIYTVAGDGQVGSGSEGDGGAARLAQLTYPTYVAVDRDGNVVIADTQDERVRMVAETAGTFYGVAMKPGDIYTVAGNGIAGFSGDGGPAASAEVSTPEGVTVNSKDGLFIVDNGNYRLRKVTP